MGKRGDSFVTKSARYVIRLGRPDESGEIAALLHAAFAEQRGRIQPESAALAENAESIAARFADHGIAVADQAGRLVGCVFYQRQGEEIYLGRLASLPECRGQGIGSALLDHVEAHACLSGAARIALGVRVALTNNRRFFEARGYREIGRKAHAGFTEPTSIRYEKSIRA
jgi:GNAT superfamily N-acetyltransferase